MELNSIDSTDNKLNALITKLIKEAFNYFVSNNLTVNCSQLTFYINNIIKTFKKIKFTIPFSEYFIKQEMKKIVSDLRNLAKNQIEHRLKLLQDGSYVPNDILAITLKTHGK